MIAFIPLTLRCCDAARARGYALFIEHHMMPRDFIMRYLRVERVAPAAGGASTNVCRRRCHVAAVTLQRLRESARR